MAIIMNEKGVVKVLNTDNNETLVLKGKNGIEIPLDKRLINEMRRSAYMHGKKTYFTDIKPLFGGVMGYKDHKLYGVDANNPYVYYEVDSKVLYKFLTKYLFN